MRLHNGCIHIERQAPLRTSVKIRIAYISAIDIP